MRLPCIVAVSSFLYCSCKAQEDSTASVGDEDAISSEELKGGDVGGATLEPPLLMGGLSTVSGMGSPGVLAVNLEDVGVESVDAEGSESDTYLGQEYGVIVAVPARLNEPPDVDYDDWLPTSNPLHSLDSVGQEDASSGWPDVLQPNLDEVWKIAVQNVYPLPEPWLAKVLALQSDALLTRRLQAEFLSARRRALYSDVGSSGGSSELSLVEQEALISNLLEPADSGSSSSSASVVSLSSTSSSTRYPNTGGPYKSVGVSIVSESIAVGSADLSGTSRVTIVSPIALSGGVLAVDPGTLDEGTTGEASTTTKGAIHELNDILSNINQALGGVTTSTVSPQVAIAQGVQNFISGLNLLALQLGKHSS